MTYLSYRNVRMVCGAFSRCIAKETHLFRRLISFLCDIMIKKRMSYTVAPTNISVHHHPGLERCPRNVRHV